MKAQRGTVSTLSPGATGSLTQTLAPTGAGPDGAAVSSAGATAYLDDTLILPPLGGEYAVLGHNQGLGQGRGRTVPIGRCHLEGVIWSDATIVALDAIRGTLALDATR